MNAGNIPDVCEGSVILHQWKSQIFSYYTSDVTDISKYLLKIPAANN